jgi:hypothetical protein
MVVIELEGSEGMSSDIPRGLSRLYKVRICLWGTWLALIPLMAIAVAIQPPDWLMRTIGFVWFGSWVVLVLVHGFYRCPSCRRFFNVKLLRYGNPFTSECLHCGISIRAPARRV